MFNQRLKLLRIEKQLTQQDLSKVMNISVSAIGMYEQGRRVPGIELIQNLAKYFDVTTDYLLGYSDDRKGKISDDRFENELKDILIKNGIISEDEEISEEKKEWLMKLIDKAIDMSKL